MALNLKGDGMVSVKKYQGVLWILCIIIYTYEKKNWADDKNAKITRKLCSNPPRVMAKLALQIKYDPPKFHNRVWELVSYINGYP